MFKIIGKILLLTILYIVLVFGGLYGLANVGRPLDNPKVLGVESISVPENLQDQDKTLTIVSYNIRLLTKEDVEEHYWSNRKEPMVNLIDDMNPDIIGFQEVTHPQYRYLIENMSDEYNYYGLYRSGLNLERGDIIVPDPDPNPTLTNQLFISIVDEGSPIFYKKSRFELLEADNFWLSETPDKPSAGWDASIKRICTYVTLKDHYTDEIITVYNTHFDHKGEIAREESGKLIYDYIDESQGKAIAMGDFNIPEGEDVYNTIIEGSLSDSKYLAPLTNRDNIPSYNGYGKYTRDVPIDFIFVDERYYDSLNYKVVSEKNDEYYISDHFPIKVELEFNADEQED